MSPLIRMKMTKENTRTKSGRRRFGRYIWVLLLIAVLGVGWALVSPRYYNWVMSDQEIDVVIFCDTSELDVPNLQAIVMYDKIALTPAARALGLFQNRPPEQVKLYFPMPVREVKMTPVSITLKAVQYGPISRIFFNAGEKKFHVNVPDRRLFNNTIYVRCSR